MSTLQTVNIKNASSSVNNIVLGTDGSVTSQGTIAMATPFAMRNKIINGAMAIDQRNSGAAVTTTLSYPVDRFFVSFSTSGAISAQQSSSIFPTGFSNSLGVTVTTADASIGATDFLFVQQTIEGSNVVDLAFGTASAQSVTASFWVRSSVTGTYGFVIGNGGSTGSLAPDRTYVSQYTINSANTWEYKTITIPGDTAGTWFTNNLRGLVVRFGLTAGSNSQQATGSWGTVNASGTSSQTQLLSTLNATWYVTGVQLEIGFTATPFERRLYPQELAMCQRYYEKSYDVGTLPGSATNVNVSYWYNAQTGASALLTVPYKVQKRAAPTITQYSGSTGASGVVRNSTSATDVTGFTTFTGESSFAGGTNAAGALAFYAFQWTANSEI